VVISAALHRFFGKKDEAYNPENLESNTVYVCHKRYGDYIVVHL